MQFIFSLFISCGPFHCDEKIKMAKNIKKMKALDSITFPDWKQNNPDSKSYLILIFFFPPITIFLLVNYLHSKPKEVNRKDSI